MSGGQVENYGQFNDNFNNEPNNSQNGKPSIMTKFLMYHNPDFENLIQKIPNDDKKYGIIIYKKTEKNLLKNKNMMGMQKYTQTNLNKMSNNNKIPLLNNVKILIAKNNIEFLNDQVKYIHNKMIKSRSGSCFSNFSGSKIRLRIKSNNNKEEVWCVPENKEYIEKYTQKNDFKLGDIVVFNQETNKWNLLGNNLIKGGDNPNIKYRSYTSMIAAFFMCPFFYTKLCGKVSRKGRTVYRCGFKKHLSNPKWEPC